MAKKEAGEKGGKTNLYLLAIVAIVAVVGIVVLILNSGSSGSWSSSDYSGEAIIVGTNTGELSEDTKRCCDPGGSCGSGSACVNCGCYTSTTTSRFSSKATK